jgi:hypothetical protein
VDRPAGRHCEADEPQEEKKPCEDQDQSERDAEGFSRDDPGASEEKVPATPDVVVDGLRDVPDPGRAGTCRVRRTRHVHDEASTHVQSRPDGSAEPVGSSNPADPRGLRPANGRGRSMHLRAGRVLNRYRRWRARREQRTEPETLVQLFAAAQVGAARLEPHIDRYVKLAGCRVTGSPEEIGLAVARLRRETRMWFAACHLLSAAVARIPVSHLSAYEDEEVAEDGLDADEWDGRP